MLHGFKHYRVDGPGFYLRGNDNAEHGYAKVRALAAGVVGAPSATPATVETWVRFSTRYDDDRTTWGTWHEEVDDSVMLALKRDLAGNYYIKEMLKRDRQVAFNPQGENDGEALDLALSMSGGQYGFTTLGTKRAIRRIVKAYRAYKARKKDTQIDTYKQQLDAMLMTAHCLQQDHAKAALELAIKAFEGYFTGGAAAIFVSCRDGRGAGAWVCQYAWLWCCSSYH